MKIKINGKQATVEMSVEHLMGILELAIDNGPYFWNCWKCNELVEEIVSAIDTSKLDKFDKSFVDEIKKEMKTEW